MHPKILVRVNDLVVKPETVHQPLTRPSSPLVVAELILVLRNNLFGRRRQANLRETLDSQNSVLCHRKR